MNTKRYNILNNLDSAKKTTHRVYANPKPEKTDSTEKTKEHLLRIHKLEKAKAYLENQVEEGKKELAESVAKNNRFLSIVTHDLRSPLCTTIGVFDLLKEGITEGDKLEVEELIDIASNSANNTLSLLDELLAWSVTQNSEKSFNPVKINLNELINDELESFNATTTQKQITITHSIVPNLYITADLQMTKTIFRNLISNAIKFTYTGGKILISATEGKKFVEIEVKDNGTGMSEETQKKLFKFDKFHSLKGTNNEQGTGLGLLFCKEFVGLHGGKIWVESEPGKGSKFKFTLPHYI